MRRVLIAALAAAAFATFAASAHAQDAFWRGSRGQIWQQGPDQGRNLSNWYTKRPGRGGRMARVPIGTAAFADGAQEFEVLIASKREATRIDTIQILENAPQYSFVLNPSAAFVLGGQGADEGPDQGLFTLSPVAPRFVLKPFSSFVVGGQAQLRARGELKSAVFDIEDDARLVFSGKSVGGNADVNLNGGAVRFLDQTSADEMRITLGSPAFAFFPIVTFEGRSTPGKSTLNILRQGVVDLSLTTGPNGDRSLTVGAINLDGTLDIGLNAVAVERDLSHPLNGGELIVEIKGDRIGTFIVKGKAQLAGNLRILPRNGGKPVKSGTYRILSAKGGRQGGYRLDNRLVPGARLENTEKEVRLIVP